MSKLTITGNIKAKDAHIDSVKEALLKLIPLTRDEEGCLQYDLHQDLEDPSYFIFYENWSSRDLWKKHMQTPHLQAYLRATQGMIEKSWVHELTHIG